MPFILQQAIWLYERELEHVRGQMLKVNRNVYTKPQELGKNDFVYFINSNLLVKTVTRDFPRPRGERHPHQRASSSFSPRRRQSELSPTVREASKLRPTNPGSPTTLASPRIDIDRHASPPMGKSSDSGSSLDAPESSRRLLSMSRTFSGANLPSKLREADTAIHDEHSSEQSGFEDDLDEDLYDAFLPIDYKSKPSRPAPSGESESVSFSDLSDTSISKSALEEALLSDYRSRLH